MIDDLHVHGGMHSFHERIEDLHAHGGVFYIHGPVGDIHHHGGIIYDQRPTSRVEFRTDETAARECAKLKKEVQRMGQQLKQSLAECENLRKKLKIQSDSQDNPESHDAVLIRRINRLMQQLTDESAAHRREVDELKWRLEAVTDIANERGRCRDETKGRNIAVTDDLFDVLFTFINLYPYTTDIVLHEEFGISDNKIKALANALRLCKSKEARQAAREYLQRQGRDIVEQRGGSRSAGQGSTQQGGKESK